MRLREYKGNKKLDVLLNRTWLIVTRVKKIRVYLRILGEGNRHINLIFKI